MKFWKRNREIAEEIEAHLRMAERDEIDPRQFGNALLIREATRDVWGWTRLEKFTRDLRYALRQIRRAPGFAAVAIATLALGLGATTAMFSIVNGVLLEPLRFRDPGRLYLARYVAPPNSGFKGDYPVNARHFHEWRSRCQSCEQVSLMHPMDITLTGAGEPRKLLGLEVSFNFFRTLGVQPALGRDFLPEEENNSARVILSNALWRTAFASDTGVVGRGVQLNGETYTVIGVMPADLHLPRGEQWGRASGPNVDPLIFRSLLADPSRAQPRGSFNYTSVIRLKPGIQPSRAQDELRSLVLEYLRVSNSAEIRPVLFPLRDKMTAGARAALWLLLGAVGAVLLIVCVNVGNLMLARTASRHREAGVRMALGASRAELFRLVLSEALMLVAVGGALGFLVAWVGLRAFAAAAPVDLPRIDEIGIDWRVLGFAAGAVLLSTGLCGVLPAWRLSRADPQASLKGSGRASLGLSHGLSHLVTAEIALGTLLLVTAGLLTLSFIRLMRADKGFETAHVVTQDISFLNPKYAGGGRNRFVPLIVDKLRQIPGVRAVGLTSTLPLRGEDWTDRLIDPSEPARDGSKLEPLADYRFVTPDYWTAMGIPLKQGRFFRESEKDAPVAVVSERAAQFLWPGRDPIGRHVIGTGYKKQRLEVIGVVADVRSNVEQDPPMTVYEPYNLVSPIGAAIVVRTLREPGPVIRSMQTALRAADPDMALAPVKTMEQIVDESVATRRFETVLAAAFALAALALASLGVYGVISFSVARRTPEIGIRIALGARAPQLAAMVLRQGMSPVWIGLAIGLGCALLAGRFISSQLYGVSPSDPAAISAVALLLLAVAAAACWIPARRAMRIDPQRALRFE
ncbi:MAG TPA: ABC transporter permease [Bryobacteraceae bacterium]|jgi:putative ABC transport system permease protein